jgi:hypothetical protein
MQAGACIFRLMIVRVRVVCRKKSHHLQKRPFFAGGVPEKVTSPALADKRGI